MKHILALLFLIITTHANAQDLNDPKVQDTIVKSFTWDIQKEEKGTLMFLDVPYVQDGKDSTEYATITVAKDKSKSRPDFISVIVPANVVQGNGIFVTFSKTIKDKEGKWGMEMQKEGPVRVLFERCNNEYCTARMVDGFAYHDDTKVKVDVFQKILEMDHLLILFIYADGSHKSIAVPLFSFKEQYKTLK